jgi:sulfur-oxidizing protein SoxX
MIATKRNVALSLAAGLVLALQTGASAQTAPKQADPAVVEAFIKATFGKVSPEWQARIQPDETLQACNKFRNNAPPNVAEAITKRELARVVFPADGKVLGDWKSGAKIANNGRGGQFSDPPGTVSGGNCYACHQMEEKELSFGTLGPSLTRYGKDRKFDAEDAKAAYTKIFNSQAVVACSNMPRFGANGVLSEQQIKDLVAFLFDPESPVNK